MKNHRFPTFIHGCAAAVGVTWGDRHAQAGLSRSDKSILGNTGKRIGTCDKQSSTKKSRGCDESGRDNRWAVVRDSRWGTGGLTNRGSTGGLFSVALGWRSRELEIGG